MLTLYLFFSFSILWKAIGLNYLKLFPIIIWFFVLRLISCLKKKNFQCGIIGKNEALPFGVQIKDKGSPLLPLRLCHCRSWSINSSFLNRVNSPFRAPWFILTFYVHFNSLKNSACYYSKMIFDFQIADLNKMGFLHLLYDHIIPSEIRLNQSNSWMADLY